MNHTNDDDHDDDRCWCCCWLLLTFSSKHSSSSMILSSFHSKANTKNRIKQQRQQTKGKHREIIEMKQMMMMNPNELMKCDYKILLIGSKGSGKSSLVGRFLGRPFNQRMKPTVGFNLMTLDL